MPILVLTHHPDEGPALLGETLTNFGHELCAVPLYDGAALPAHLKDVDGIIAMGGPMNVDEATAHPWISSEMAFLKSAHENGPRKWS